MPLSLMEFLDYAGVAVFAATGALAASRKELDLIGFLFLAAVTGIGGGTLRDLILGRVPVFWVLKPTYLIVCVAMGVVVYLVIPPFLTGLCSRIHAAIFNFCAGVMPPMPILGRSLL